MFEIVDIKVALSSDATLPEYATSGASGMDVRTIEDVHLEPMERKLVRTGLRIEVPAGFEVQVRPRSGLALKKGLTLPNSPGTIDSDYRGEVGVIMANISTEAVHLEKGERIAQLVVCPVAKARLHLVESLSDTDRGEGGYGSTGTR